MSLFLRPFALRDIFLDGDVMRDFSLFVRDRRDDGRLPEHLAVLAAVLQLAPPLPPLESDSHISLYTAAGMLPDFRIRGFLPMTSCSS